MDLTSPAVLGMLAIAGVAFVLGSWKTGEGWRSVALRYPMRGRKTVVESRFRFASLQLAIGDTRPMNYRNCVTIELDDLGIHFSVWGPFQIGHPPFHLPWEAVVGCDETFTPLGDTARLQLGNDVVLQIHGPAGRAVLGSLSDPAVH